MTNPAHHPQHIDVPLEIESVLEMSLPGQGVFVLARCVERIDFSICDAATLAGLPLAQYLDVPRLLSTNGQPRADVFAFRLLRASDAHCLAPGQQVTLTACSGIGRRAVVCRVE
jgi:hypothetical protein